jgi:hypothetical protein
MGLLGMDFSLVAFGRLRHSEKVKCRDCTGHAATMRIDEKRFAHTVKFGR